ncbi:MAG TPA: SDR family NAD(P)-dependent oxidoreductase, partial [Polyangiaceae bacterium]|nr:SDR family NAD(P)-dependent oxidoreductase [Polyangiaceae bacterium]
TLLLRQRLCEGRGRVVNISSDLHRKARGIDFAALRSPARLFGMHEYRASKLCNVLFSQQLAQRWAQHGISSVALHPGSVATGMQRQIPPPARWLLQRFLLPADLGAKTTLFCATDPSIASGRYYEKEREAAPSVLAQDEPLAKRLWHFSEDAIT